MAQRASPSRLTGLYEEDLLFQSIPDLSPSFFEYASDSEDRSSKSKTSSISSSSSKNPKRGRRQTGKSAKTMAKKQKMRLSNGRTKCLNSNTNNREHDLIGRKVNWRSTLGDEPLDEDGDVVSESEEWYNGETLESQKPIPGEWILIPPSKTLEEADLEAEIEEERNTFQPFTQDPDEMFQILPRVPEATVQELRVAEEEARRYRWAVGTRELVGIGLAGVGMFLGLSGRILRDLERFF